ncbi:MAG TPA: flagellar motor stator protein MotA [Bacillota bacterium]|nr:flagellar motor stator protein MotA [Bacillota bacterium]
MDRTTFIGIILGVVAVGLGMVLKGVSLVALVNPAAILIIFIGTAAAVLIAFPMHTIKKVPKLFGVIFKEKEDVNLSETIQMFTEFAELTRREGVLSLETKLDEINDPFLASGIQLAVDGQSPDFIRDVMMEKVDAMEVRHAEGAAVFSQAGTYAPTLGVLGAVVGLIASLANLEDMEVLGNAISAAFIATLLGIFTGYVLWHPFANKLREKSKHEVQSKHIMIEGVLSLTIGESPQIIYDKLISYLSAEEISKLEEEAAHASEEE